LHLSAPGAGGAACKMQGFGDVRWAVELCVLRNIWMIPWRRIRIRQGFNGHHGLVSDNVGAW